MQQKSDEKDKAALASNAPQPKSNDTSTDAIQLRPSASSGWWLNYLLAAAYLVNCWKYERSSTIEYKISAIVVSGMVLQTEVIHFSPKIKNSILYCILFAVPSIVIFSLLVLGLLQGIVFSTFVAVITTPTYHALFLFTLRKLPNSFTYGEASIVVQGCMVFLTNLFFKLISLADKTAECMKDESSTSCIMPTSSNYWTQNYAHQSETAQLTTILQIGYLGVIFLIGSCYFVRFFRGILFYVLLALIGIVVVLFPIDNQVAIEILIRFLMKDLQKLCMIILYMGLIGITVATVGWQLNRNEKSNTRTRKIFHVLIVLVFVPGLIYQCTFLFVTSSIALALFFVLETMRIIQLPPLYIILQHSVKAFVDEKDAGIVALTPIYLLVGCSASLWLHPCPCDITDSAGFNLLPLMAGVISVGIGDTAASIAGSQFGKIKWWNSPKTVEGTVAGIVAQGLVLPCLIYFGFVRYNVVVVTKFAATITATSLVETFTDQVDNLVLPLVTYILLTL